MQPHQLATPAGQGASLSALTNTLLSHDTVGDAQDYRKVLPAAGSDNCSVSRSQPVWRVVQKNRQAINHHTSAAGRLITRPTNTCTHACTPDQAVLSYCQRPTLQAQHTSLCSNQLLHARPPALSHMLTPQGTRTRLASVPSLQREGAEHQRTGTPHRQVRASQQQD